jgi:hypothetical protein
MRFRDAASATPAFTKPRLRGPPLIISMLLPMLQLRQSSLVRKQTECRLLVGDVSTSSTTFYVTDISDAIECARTITGPKTILDGPNFLTVQ